jgi:hypothetical protein
MSGGKNDALDTLGTLLDGEHERDAVHVAVMPCVAGSLLRVGQRVSLSEGKVENDGEYLFFGGTIAATLIS